MAETAAIDSANASSSAWLSAVIGVHFGVERSLVSYVPKNASDLSSSGEKIVTFQFLPVMQNFGRSVFRTFL